MKKKKELTTEEKENRKAVFRIGIFLLVVSMIVIIPLGKIFIEFLYQQSQTPAQQPATQTPASEESREKITSASQCKEGEVFFVRDGYGFVFEGQFYSPWGNKIILDEEDLVDTGKTTTEYVRNRAGIKTGCYAFKEGAYTTMAFQANPIYRVAGRENELAIYDGEMYFVMTPVTEAGFAPTVTSLSDISGKITEIRLANTPDERWKVDEIKKSPYIPRVLSATNMAYCKTDGPEYYAYDIYYLDENEFISIVDSVNKEEYMVKMTRIEE